MNPLLLYSIWFLIINCSLSALINLFANKPNITTIPWRRFNALCSIYFLVIFSLFLAGVLK